MKNLADYSNEELIRELKSRGFVTGLMVSTIDVEKAVEGLGLDGGDMPHQEKLDALKTLDIDQYADMIMDELRDNLYEKYGGEMLF